MLNKVYRTLRPVETPRAVAAAVGLFLTRTRYPSGLDSRSHHSRCSGGAIRSSRSLTGAQKSSSTWVLFGVPMGRSEWRLRIAIVMNCRRPNRSDSPFPYLLGLWANLFQQRIIRGFGFDILPFRRRSVFFILIFHGYIIPFYGSNQSRVTVYFF